MTSSPRLLLVAALLGCGGDKPGDSGTEPDACDLPKGDDPVLEINHYGTFSELGSTAWCATPPQGGAPYAPFGVRVRGITPMENNAVHTVITAVDRTTSEEVGRTEFWDAFLCANAGESSGYWIKTEFHLRFFDYTLEELHGRSVDVRFDLEGDGDSVSETFAFELDCVAGD